MKEIIDFYNANKDWIDKVLIALASLIFSFSSFLYSKLAHKKSEARLAALEKSDLLGLYVECPRCGSKIHLSEVQIYKEVLNEKEDFKEEK